MSIWVAALLLHSGLELSKSLKSRSTHFKKGTERLNHAATTCKTSCSAQVVSPCWPVGKPHQEPHTEERWQPRGRGDGISGHAINVQEMKARAPSSLTLPRTFGVRNDQALTSDVGKVCGGGMGFQVMFDLSTSSSSEGGPVQERVLWSYALNSKQDFPHVTGLTPLILPQWKWSSSAHFIRNAS